MKMTNVLLTAVLAVTGAVTGCGANDSSAPSDGTEQQDVVVLESSGDVQQQFFGREGTTMEPEFYMDSGCTSSQFSTVMDHCQDNHASSYTCCHITSCYKSSSSGYLVYSWDGYYAC